MIPLQIRPNLETAPWDDITDDNLADGGTIERVGLLPNATRRGRPAFVLVVRLPDGRAVLAQTTWALMEGAVRALGASPVADLDRREHGS
ncbi:hypothetical protein [Nonomuraea typhae]|uniref:hypothetical protein n=1 Tax=Nonomuraea typhae TaxID=2603600 RepID=UPI0012F89826|nr:hypothetical protein [Nonomuraea typhae]